MRERFLLLLLAVFFQEDRMLGEIIRYRIGRARLLFK